MLKSVTIENYRGFDRFTLGDIGRVNLIVGTNNAGKTSVLEAVHILETPGDFGPIWSTLSRRGEDIYEDVEQTRQRYVEVRRLFRGHEAVIGSRISITAEGNQGRDEFTALITEPTREDEENEIPLLEKFESESESELPPRAAALSLHWQNRQTKADVRASVPITRRGGISLNATRAMGRLSDAQRVPVRLITAASLSPETVGDLFAQVVLTPEEDLITESLRIVEPLIERIATAGAERARFPLGGRGVGGRGGLFVRCSGVGDRIPIGSLGDGIWRLLGLALALARTEGGILLVDEIDTGLHYTVMEKMWKLVNETSKKHNIQVFATTHSRDCYESLAVVCRESVSLSSEVTIQRVEQGKPRFTAYNEQEIVAAARRRVKSR